jgi:hypothetical protein
MQRVLRSTAGLLEFQHETGIISFVHVDIAEMGLRKNRIANLPPELPDRRLRDIMSKYGDVKDITEEQ